MDNKQLIGALAQIHNMMAEISVRGDDAIRMANILTQMRGIVQKLGEEERAQEAGE